MYMYSAYLYLAATALAESDGLQRCALEYDMYSTCILYMGSISVEVLMCHSTFVHMYCREYCTFTLQSSSVASSWPSCQQIVVKSGETETTQAWVAAELCKSVEGSTDYFVRSKYEYNTTSCHSFSPQRVSIISTHHTSFHTT